MSESEKQLSIIYTDVYLLIIEIQFSKVLYKNICCGCSLESLRCGDCNEHPQLKGENCFLHFLYLYPRKRSLRGVYCFESVRDSIILSSFFIGFAL